MVFSPIVSFVTMESDRKADVKLPGSGRDDAGTPKDIAEHHTNLPVLESWLITEELEEAHLSQKES